MNGSEIMDLFKEFAGDVLQYWPMISAVVVGGLTSITTGTWAPVLTAIGTVAVGSVGAKPVAAYRAHLLAKRAK
jgi:hypothetical protein